MLGVMAGLDPAIHVFFADKNVDARDKPGHDGVWSGVRPKSSP